MKKCCFIWSTSSENLDDERELETGSVPTKKVNVIFADPPHSTRSAHGQSSPAHNVFAQRDMENVMPLKGTLIASRAHRHVFYSKLIFYQWNRSLRAEKKKIKDVEGDVEEE